MLMLKTVTVLEAISKRRRTARPAAHTGLSKNTIFAATHSAEDALVLLDATANGLTVEQATERLNAVGPNTIEATTKTLAASLTRSSIPSPASSPRSHWSRSTSTCSPCPNRSATPPRSSSSAPCCWYRAA